MLYGDIMAIRALTGLTTEDVEDGDIATIMQLANRIVLNTVQVRVNKETSTPLTDDNTVFQTKHYPIADKDGDGEVTANDITVEALSPTRGFSMWRELTISELNPPYGLIRLSTPPTNGERVFITYAYIPPGVGTEDLDDLVNLMASHLLTLRLQNPDTVAITDLGANELVVKKTDTKFLDVYKLKLSTVMSVSAMRSVNL
ncbi:MAG: hypothetical protein H0Z33_16665 [Bacillaceae bacterium]|nr:hypothetical protein [Bacillaceae bacterium]